MTDDASLALFKQNLLQESWDNVYTAGDVHESYDNFISIITVLYNDCCPVRKVSIGSKKVSKPWITNGLRNACKRKNQLYFNFIITTEHLKLNKNIRDTKIS
ncbi:hypothetical protein HOLleu_27226 [Holothuria leucospilota]|uniref:Uncharacterized protein n=1 Tax=Holothuria leucospilota TaxID=206669 RepID=A0A9Q1BPN4_HOLLE|nr:hypothetical protein HOLleu_27226 [Holothuria leucospilota]